MTRITPPADDLGRQLLQIENRKPTQARAVGETAATAPVRDTERQAPGSAPARTEGPPKVERRRGERRQGDRRRRQQPMFIDTRSGRDRRRNPGKRHTDQAAAATGIDVKV